MFLLHPFSQTRSFPFAGTCLMIEIASQKVIALLRESVDLEVKLARGAKGRGA